MRPESKDEIDEDTRRILAERDATFERDKLTALDAKKAIAAIRKKLKRPASR